MYVASTLCSAGVNRTEATRRIKYYSAHQICELGAICAVRTCTELIRSPYDHMHSTVHVEYVPLEGSGYKALRIGIMMSTESLGDSADIPRAIECRVE
jgi:hypothetical protein